jgi:hypothetical protein
VFGRLPPAAAEGVTVPPPPPGDPGPPLGTTLVPGPVVGGPGVVGGVSGVVVPVSEPCEPSAWTVSFRWIACWRWGGDAGQHGAQVVGSGGVVVGDGHEPDPLKLYVHGDVIAGAPRRGTPQGWAYPHVQARR